MALALVMLLPKRVASNPVDNRSRWLMTAGLVLIGIQFLTQYIGDFRSTDATKAIIINIAFFIPSSALICLSILNLQRQGNLKTIEKWIWVPTWVIAMTLMITAAMGQDLPNEDKSSQMLLAEIISSTLYGLTQLYYSYVQVKELKRMEEVLNNYYDRHRDDLLTWMKLNVAFLALMSLLVPVVIFASKWLLTCFGAILFTGLFYQWTCFCRYVISSDARYMSKAEEDSTKVQNETRENSNIITLSTETEQHIERSVNQWITNQNYLHKGLTNSDVAKEMKLPRYQLAYWIKKNGYSSYSNWVTTLRVNHAKSIIVAHPDWSNEAIANHCGISLSHFQKVFHEQTGMTPAQYIHSV